jgi:hypothetical protein
MSDLLTWFAGTTLVPNWSLLLFVVCLEVTALFSLASISRALHVRRELSRSRAAADVRWNDDFSLLTQPGKPATSGQTGRGGPAAVDMKNPASAKADVAFPKGEKTHLSG